ncbi:2-dehydro-3-deoxygalactonokinase [Agaribacterium sp. ZY112]|uniref:2-dehydro-3-deoxygalactonokinase n=1 Tax=Agaribacterium sp. ZY112 TaxID=3233574 RepID=UPI003525A960
MDKKESCGQRLLIDWGTTNFRAFVVDAEDELVDSFASERGLLSVESGAFSSTLQSLLEEHLASYKAMPILMAGMVGSLKGWVNVPYVSSSAGAAELSAAAHALTLPWGAKAYIIPGLSHEPEAGIYDVMRGEEVQLIGLQALLGENQLKVILPGTHSKHALMSQGQINAFKTYMTGELFSVLSKQMLFSRDLNQATIGSSDSAFLRGVSEGYCSEELMAVLFRSWTHRLFNNLKPDEVLDYLSGMLIGAELKTIGTDLHYVVGGQSLCQRYLLAAEHLSLLCQYYSGDQCFLAGMKVLSKERFDAEKA